MLKNILNRILSKAKNPLVIIVLLISVTMSLANSAQYFTDLVNIPKNTVYLGTTFYYMDYFFYLNHFFQGAHGAWLTVNRFTGENTPDSILYWPNILMGKIGGIIGLTSISSYNLSVILLSFLILLTSAYLLSKIFPRKPLLVLIGFIFSTFATSPVNHLLWRTPHLAFDRLGNVPHQMLETLLFLWLAIVYFEKNQASLLRLAVIIVLAGVLTSINSGPLSIFVISVIITSGWSLINKEKVDFIKLVFLGIISLIIFVYMYQLVHSPAHLYSILWDANQQDITTIPELLFSMGPIVFLALLGILPLITSKKPLLNFTIVLPIVSYSLFLSPLPRILGISNTRLLTPALFTFLGALAALAAEKISCLPFLKSRLHNFILTFIISVFLILSLPTLIRELKSRLVTDPTSINLFLPETIYEGYTFLKNSGNLNDIALGNPATNIDVMIPALSGHTTYSGHMLTTIDAENKKNLATGFYYLTLDNPEVWLAENHIKFIILTKYDGDLNSFREKYPFLKIIYQNPETTIFKVT